METLCKTQEWAAGLIEQECASMSSGVSTGLIEQECTFNSVMDLTPMDPQQGNANNNDEKKKQQFSKPGATPGMTDARLESMVPGLDKSIVFVCGSPHQNEKFLWARKAIRHQ